MGNETLGQVTHLVRQDKEGILGVKEGLVAQQEGGGAGIPAAVVLIGGAGVHERVVHRRVVVRPAGPAPIPGQPVSCRHPVQVPATNQQQLS